MRKINWKKLLLCLAVPVAAGGLSALITGKDMNIYQTVSRPPLSPPGWIFPVMWTILYILMGVSLYIVAESKTSNNEKSSAYRAFAMQLALNFIWSPIFFSLQNFLLAFTVLLAMWVAVLIMLVRFYKINKIAGLLQIPYLLWITFAGYLNLGIYLLNR